jgi:parvulin-like peptidyl-prolyl isomerase
MEKIMRNKKSGFINILLIPAIILAFTGTAAFASEAKVPATSAPVLAKGGGPTAYEDIPADGTVAIVNGVKILKSRIDKDLDLQARRTGRGFMAGSNAPANRKFLVDSVNGMVEMEILFQQAEKEKMLATDADVDAIIGRYIERYTQEGFDSLLAGQNLTMESLRENIKRETTLNKIIATHIKKRDVEVTDEEVREYYEVKKDEMSEEEVWARHILISTDKHSDEEARTLAEAVLKQVKEGGDFIELARKNSEGPSAPSGGDLGYFKRSTMVKPFADTAFSMEVGQVSDLVKTQFGYHIIKVEGKKTPDFESLKVQIRDQFTREKQQKLARDDYQEYVNQLKEDNDIVWVVDLTVPVE